MLFEEIIKDAEGVPQTIDYKLDHGLATLDDQDEALKDPESAYWFAKRVSGADIEKCQEVVCKNPEWSFWFARLVEEADVEKCQEVACQDSLYAYMFAHWIPGADIEKCRKACEGTEYAF